MPGVTPPPPSEEVSPAPVESASAVVSSAPIGPTVDPNDGSVCFPSDAKVQLESGAVKQMREVEIGDRVLVSHGVYSEVFMFTHRDSARLHTFISLITSCGHVMTSTKGHYIYINKRLSEAFTARIGDTLELSNGTVTRIESISHVVKRGLYNPQTVQGDIIVNGIRASTFTRTVKPMAAQAVLTPLRAVYKMFGWGGSMDYGADALTGFLPTGVSS